MTYPKIKIDLNKIKKNIRSLKKMSDPKGITIAGVTKVFCADPIIAKAYMDAGVDFLADSRVENLKKLKGLDIEKIMLRLPMISEAEDVVRYADISLNSELKTIKALDLNAGKLGKLHKVILMFDLGDLREGYFSEEDLYSDIEDILKLENIKLIGIGTNMACYGGIVPEESSMDRLSVLKDKIERNFNIKLDIISGGNSSALHLLKDSKLGVTNNLRLGESIVLGQNPSLEKMIEGGVDDAFTLEVEIIEVKEKPSYPIGKIGLDAFGNIPKFEDKGIRKRMICGIGKQDVDIDSIYPIDQSIDLFGASSDHLIVDGSDSQIDYKVGDILEFKLGYGGILRLMTSEYVTKEIIEG